MVELVGSATPRIFTPPLRELTPETSWGFDVIWFAREILKEPLTPWQEWFAIHSLELMPPEMVRQIYPRHPEVWEQEILRFKTILLLIARQNGKTHMAKVMIKWALFRKRLRRILGAAQTKNDAKELWEEILEESEENPQLRRRMRKTSFNNGSEAIRSKWGMYKIAATSRRAGRGKTNNFLFLDELREHTSWDGYSALSSTTLSPVGAFNLLASNAGDRRSVVLKTQRENAIRAIQLGETDQSTVFIAEWSAEPHRDIDDREGWAEANPELGHGRMTERDLLAEREAKDDDEFRTENLCQWVDDLLADDFIPIIDLDLWDSLAVHRPVRVGECVLAIEVSPDGETVSLVSAGQTLRGVHVQTVECSGDFSVDKTVKAVQRFVALHDPGLVVLDKDTPAGALITALVKVGVEPVQLTGGKVSTALRTFERFVKDKQLTHDGNALWEDSLRVATKRGEESKFPSIERFSGDVSTLVAGTFAVWGLETYLAESGSLFKQVDVVDENPAGAALPMAVEVGW
ncbi:terminase large subunit [Corynebacterium glutamicum]|uniref:terminase large subunit n=1 Tax=Corynebacterium glutamicum TaxID=1718 RepID=UPI001B8C700A|nr:terminase large subunit [Corynebacterium glutamicum]